MNQYSKGDLIRCSATFTTSDGTATNPTAVRCQVRTPAGTTTEYVYGTDAELVRASTGNYYVDVDANAVGTWRYRFYSTGTGQAADEEAFRVKDSWF
jgi:uncharacterized protein YfaS (alpha-2-macroglobulin family)